MLKLLISIVKIGALVALALWVASQDGAMSFTWNEYKITVRLGVALVALLGVLLLTILLYRVYRGVIDAPKKLANRNAQRRKEKGQKALSLGMTAVAAGDAKVAAYQAYRAQKYLDENAHESQGMVLLLEAQAHRLSGDETAANKSFAALLQNPETAFLGLRGLLQAALDHAQYDKARDYAEEALRLHPKQPWILRIVYDLELRARDWRQAASLLKRLEKAGGFAAAEAKAERAAMEAAQGIEFAEENKLENAAHHYRLALKQDASFAAAGILLADVYAAQESGSKLRSHLEKTIKANAHPELIARWAAFGREQSGASDNLAQMQWMERLKSVAPEAMSVKLALARAAIDAALWGEARSYLEQVRSLEAAHPPKMLFDLMAELEEQTTGDDVAIAAWLEEGASADDNPVWYCAKSGMVLPAWQPFSPFNGAFNSVMWGHPYDAVQALNAPAAASAAVKLQPPKA